MSAFDPKRTLGALTEGPSFKLSLWHDTMITPEVSWGAKAA
jgi:hypothetical protein